MKQFFPILMALTAYTMLSLGFVLQKKGIRWMGWKEAKNRVYYGNLAVWVSGFLIMNIYGVPSAIALKTLPPHIVAAFAGWGIVMLVLFSRFFLQEKIHRSDYYYSAAIVLGIFLLGWFEPHVQPNGYRIRAWGLILLTVVPTAIVIAALPKSLGKRLKTGCYASVSGMAAALMVVSLRLLVVRYGYDVSLYPASVFLYLYVFSALLSLVALQLALKSGSMIAVGPLQYAANIIYPVIAALLVFGQSLHIMQIPAVGLIVYSVSALLKKH